MRKTRKVALYKMRGWSPGNHWALHLAANTNPTTDQLAPAINRIQQRK